MTIIFISRKLIYQLVSCLSETTTLAFFIHPLTKKIQSLHKDGYCLTFFVLRSISFYGTDLIKRETHENYSLFFSSSSFVLVLFVCFFLGAHTFSFAETCSLGTGIAQWLEHLTRD